MEGQLSRPASSQEGRPLSILAQRLETCFRNVCTFRLRNTPVMSTHGPKRHPCPFPFQLKMLSRKLPPWPTAKQTLAGRKNLPASSLSGLHLFASVYESVTGSVYVRASGRIE